MKYMRDYKLITLTANQYSTVNTTCLRSKIESLIGQQLSHVVEVKMQMNPFKLAGF